MSNLHAPQRPLCHYDDGDGRRLLSATLDELTLTYCVVEQGRDGHALTLRRHVPSLLDARRWATTYRNERLGATAHAGEAAHRSSDPRCRA
jgi:hypothetical protein